VAQAGNFTVRHFARFSSGAYFSMRLVSSAAECRARTVISASFNFLRLVLTADANAASPASASPSLLSIENHSPFGFCLAANVSYSR
jgi:hypothetical protein